MPETELVSSANFEFTINRSGVIIGVILYDADLDISEEDAKNLEEALYQKVSEAIKPHLVPRQ